MIPQRQAFANTRIEPSTLATATSLQVVRLAENLL